MAGRVIARLAVAGSIVAGVVGGVASPAWAPKYILGSFAFGQCEIDDVGETSFAGDFTVTSFEDVGGTLYVVGSLSGTCIDGLDHVAAVAPGVYRFPVVDFTVECNDEFAGIDLRPGAERVGGTLTDDKDTAVRITLDLYPSTIVERTWMPGEERSVRGRLCALFRMSQHRTPAELAGQLNQLVMRV